ncbi:Putative Structural maintenance of chromosomes protein [Rhizopus microsporus]|nr:Putative Structural maintenance of chromosomes protein [Rhizopus microsporus]
MDKPSPNKKIKISPESDASETSTNTTLTAVEASVEQRPPSTTPSVKNDVKRVAFMETNKEQSVPSKKEPRLAMKKMVLNDFKSYAGRQVIGPFHKSFSAIVGPNGSGKSNVIDALLFVFGYRANKMRQGKLSELIHNSAKYPNCQTCSVEIHFHEIIDGDDPNDYTVVPNSELVIARQANRNNSSKYFINNKSSNFTEVTTLLKTRGIDLDHKRFLILQGEVESIALMKPKAKDNNDDGLLEYLEDIIGTSKYKAPIEEASVRLEALNEIRGEKVGRVKYVSRELASMEEKKAEAENYLENENELAQRRNELYQIYLYETKQNIDVANQAIEELNAKLVEESQKYADIEKEKSVLNEVYQTASKEYNEIEKESETYIKQQAKLEKEEVQLRERKEHLIKRQEKGAETLENDKKR